MTEKINETMTEENTETAAKKTKAGEQQGGEDVKTFTQAEVNDIVKKRLAKQKESLLKNFQEGAQLTELEERERNITQRELKADVLETLASESLPKGLAELVNYENAAACKESLDKITDMFNMMVNDRVGSLVKKSARQKTPMEGNAGFTTSDPLRSVFGMKK